MNINLFIREDYLTYYGISQQVLWNPSKAPHVIVVGATGSGKSYGIRLLLGKLALKVDKLQLTILDFKGDDDFIFLNKSKRFYRFMECMEGFNAFYEAFRRRQRGEDTSRTMMVLMFDEWASYCNSLEKKVAEEEKRKLTNILMLGRSFNVHIIVSQQRADSIYFATARDNFNLVIGMGNLSEESKNMLFREFKEEMSADRRQGTGYMITNGTNLMPIIVPTVSDYEKLNQIIKKTVNAEGI